MAERRNQTVNLATLKGYCREVTDPAELFRADPGNAYLKVHAGETFACAPPLNIDDDADARARFTGTDVEPRYSEDMVTNEVFLAVLADARLATQQSLLFSRHGLLFADSYHHAELVIHPMQRTRDVLPVDLRFDLDGEAIAVPARIARFDWPPHRVTEPALLLTAPWCEGYHHWIFETLSRLWARDEFPELADLHLVAPAWMKSFHLEILEALGVDAGRLILFDGRAMDFDRLYVPSFLAPGGISRRQVDWLKRTYLTAFGIEKVDSGDRRLYLSRADTGKRDVANLDEIEPLLADFGFESVTPGTLSVREQLELFAGAGIVLAPHGSALTNFLFAPDAAKLIELFPRSYVNLFYWRLAAARKQEYAFLIGADVNDRGDFKIDAARLAALLEKMSPSLS